MSFECLQHPVGTYGYSSQQLAEFTALFYGCIDLTASENVSGAGWDKQR